MFFGFGFGFYSLDIVLFMAFKKRRRTGEKADACGLDRFLKLYSR
jgi:hypothetical protein